MFNIHERIGFTDNTDNPHYKVIDESNKLTIAELNGFVGYILCTMRMLTQSQL